MDDNLAIFLVLVIAIVGAVVLIVTASWIRTRHRLPQLEAAQGGLAALRDENETLKSHVARLEDRLHVLERIAVDPAERTARAIEQLR